MDDLPESRQLLEIYKLHAELADRVSQRRARANGSFAALLMALVVSIGIITALPFQRTGPIVVVLGGLVGAALSAAWYITIRSYRQLNSGKFAALHELEAKLPYPFFKREWELLKAGKDFRAYWKLTVVETLLPATFFVLCAVLALAGMAWSN